MRRVKSVTDSPPRAFPAWAPPALLAALALYVRLRGLPGAWGSDSLAYFESCRDDHVGAMDPRSDRWLALVLIRASLRASHWSPAVASLPGVIASTAVVPVLWLALRRRLGDALALVPCALWAFLGLDVERVVTISTDAMVALPAACALLGLVVAARRDDGRTAPLVAAGLACGIGATLKETMLFATVGFAAGAFCVGRGPRRWKNAAALAVPALVVFAASLLVTPSRVVNASQYMVDDPKFVPAGGAAFLRRVTVELPELLVTATQAFGLLFVACVPLIARLPFRALRGDPIAATTLVGFAAFDVGPVSLKGWSLLPGDRPRYLLCMMPTLFAALVDALRERVVDRTERWISLGAAAAALWFAHGSTWAAFLVPPGLVLAAWPALPEPVTRVLSERVRLGLAGGVLIATCVAWTGLAATPTRADWTVAVAAGVLVATPWLLGRDHASPAPYFAAGTAIVLAVAMARSRFVPDEEWTAWARLPPAGRVYSERLVGRRLRAAAVSAGADPSRVTIVESDADRPRRLAPDDRIVARSAGPLDRGLRLADACRLPGSGLVEDPVALGECAIFAPAPR